MLFTGTFEEKTGYRYGNIKANLDPRPDAVIVTDDLVAFGVMRVFERLRQDISPVFFRTQHLFFFET